MLAARRKRLSVMPVIMPGSTVTPGHMLSTPFFEAEKTSGRSGDAGGSDGSLNCQLIATPSSAIASHRVFISQAEVCPGTIRQLIVLVSVKGPSDNTPILLNGDADPVPIELKQGVRYRFRFINITPHDPLLTVSLLADYPGGYRSVARIEMPITATPAGSAIAFTRAESALQ
jgi:hypothetical protein